MSKQKATFLDRLVPFLCGMLASVWPIVLSGFFFDFGFAGFAMVCYGLSCIFLPFTPMLLIPAIQLRSRRLAIRALWLGPVLVVAQTILSFGQTIDLYRLLTPFPLLVPGMSDMTPGGSIDNLVPQFGSYVSVLTLALAPNYWRTRVLGISYFLRVILGGIGLLYLLRFDIGLTTVWWSDTDPLYLEHFRRNWIIASMSWLCLTGAYWSFVFGVRLEDKPKVSTSPAT